jgi:hypothetical protein
MTIQRFLSFFVISIIVIVTATVAFLYANRNALIKEIIVEVGSQTFGTQVSVGDVDVKPFQYSISISDFSIQNPPSFPKKEALGFSKIFVQMPSKLSLSPLHIQNISVSQPRINLFYEHDNNNLQTLIDHTKSPETSSSKKEYLLRIDSLSIDKPQVSVTSSLTLGKTLSLSLPSFSAKNIGKPDGIKPKELANIILSEFINQSKKSLEHHFSNFTENINNLLKNTEEKTKNFIDDASKTLNSIFN